jgi:hypothetical protein
MWFFYMLLGAWGYKAFQVCFRAMSENDSWDSIMELERAEGRL